MTGTKDLREGTEPMEGGDGGANDPRMVALRLAAQMPDIAWMNLKTLVMHGPDSRKHGAQLAVGFLRPDESDARFAVIARHLASVAIRGAYMGHYDRPDLEDMEGHW